MITLLIVMVGWVFFRAPGLDYAITYLGIMFGFVQPENVGFLIGYYLTPKLIFIWCLALVASTPVIKTLSLRFQNIVILKPVVSVLIIVLFFISIVFVIASSYNPFIYFRF